MNTSNLHFWNQRKKINKKNFWCEKVHRVNDLLTSHPTKTDRKVDSQKIFFLFFSYLPGLLARLSRPVLLSAA